MELEIVKVEKVKRSLYRNNYRDYNKLPRAYVFFEDFNVLEDYLARQSGVKYRLQSEYRKHMKKALEKAGWWTKTAERCGNEYKLRWSDKAGCSCGCSPGFVIGTDEFAPKDYPVVDLHITFRYKD